MQLRNAPTSLMKALGYGEGYRHAHNEMTDEGAYAPGENYFPEEIRAPVFYQPHSAGLEEKIRLRLARLHGLDQAAAEHE